MCVFSHEPECLPRTRHSKALLTFLIPNLSSSPSSLPLPSAPPERTLQNRPTGQVRRRTGVHRRSTNPGTSMIGSVSSGASNKRIARGGCLGRIVVVLVRVALVQQGALHCLLVHGADVSRSRNDLRVGDRFFRNRGKSRDLIDILNRSDLKNLARTRRRGDRRVTRRRINYHTANGRRQGDASL